MKRQRHVAVLTTGHPATLLALEHGGIAATVLEEYGLLAALQGLAHTGQEKGREGAAHHLATLQVLNVDDLDLGQFDALMTLAELDEAVLAGLGIVVGLQRGRGGAQKNLWF